MPPVFAVYRCVQMDVCSFVVLGFLFCFISFLFKFTCHDFVVVVVDQIHGTEIRVFHFCCCSCGEIVNVSADYTVSYWIYMCSLGDQFGDNFYLNVRDKNL